MSWLNCLKQLQKKIPGNQFIKYINPLQIKNTKNTIIILAPNYYILDKIKNYYLPIIKNIILDASNAKIKIMLQINIDINITKNFNKETSFLNVNKNFNNFIEGKINKFVKIAALEVSKNYCNLYNPLLIYGDQGTGKSHIINAIGNYIQKYRKNIKFIIITAEKFSQTIIKALKENTILILKNTYKTYDILIIEDIHTFPKQNLFQNEFYCILNTLTLYKKQIILTSYNKPENIITLNKKIISKLQEGLIIKILEPDINVKIKILENISNNLKIKINKNIIKFIAANTNTNKLEGFLKYITIKSYPSKTITSLNFAKELLQNTKNRQQVSMTKIINIISIFYGINKNMIYTRKRNRSAVFTRQIIFYFCKKFTKHSLAEIGYKCGKYSHATVLYSYKKIETLINHKKLISNDIKQIKNKLLE